MNDIWKYVRARSVFLPAPCSSLSSSLAVALEAARFFYSNLSRLTRKDQNPNPAGEAPDAHQSRLWYCLVPSKPKDLGRNRTRTFCPDSLKSFFFFFPQETGMGRRGVSATRTIRHGEDEKNNRLFISKQSKHGKKNNHKVTL